MSTAAQQKQAFDIFARLCDASPADRDRLLAELCAGDDGVRQAVEKMLHADDSGRGTDADAAASGFLARSLDQLKTDEAQANLAGEARGGHYRIIRVIGEGGMGTVYEAEQVHPRRRVAIKAIRSFLGSPALRRRFEFEAQVLARLEHPGIARLYEADLRTGDRDVQAYLAMEFVDGLPIDEYADRQKLSVRDRLELFVRLCEPVEYAHRMGVIHRDLKPANLFVQEDGQVKVLDFGIARSVNDSGHSMVTLTGQMVGTLSYMSPEQLESRPEIDTRATSTRWA
ncbi:MAG: serine/threonine-protein kinase [Tepidisphaeraceae bacterium]